MYWHSIKNGKKQCKKCKQLLPLDKFTLRKKKGRGCGLTSTCKECNRIFAKEYRMEHPYSADKRRLRILKEYHLTIDDFNKIYDEQNGKCKICGIPEIEITFGKDKRLFIDHNHSTGKVRGLLCHRCNTGVGLFNEDVAILNKVIDYLGRWLN